MTRGMTMPYGIVRLNGDPIQILRLLHPPTHPNYPSSQDLSIAGAMARAAGPEASKGGDAIKTSLEILGAGKTKLKHPIPEALAPIVNGETLNTQEKTGTWKLAGDSVMLT